VWYVLLNSTCKLDQCKRRHTFGRHVRSRRGDLCTDPCNSVQTDDDQKILPEDAHFHRGLQRLSSGRLLYFEPVVHEHCAGPAVESGSAEPGSYLDSVLLERRMQLCVVPYRL